MSVPSGKNKRRNNNRNESRSPKGSRNINRRNVDRMKVDRSKENHVQDEINVMREDRLEGKNPILEAYISGRTVNKLWILESDNKRTDPVISRILGYAKKEKTPVIEVSRSAMDSMAVTHGHQGIIAQTASHEYVEVQDIIDRAESCSEPPFILMIDGLKDAYNLGSILRIADAAGVHGVIIPRHRSIGLDAMVAKTSAGAIEHVPVARVSNLSQTILSLRDKGFWVFGTEAQAEASYDSVDYKGPIIVVVGSEGDGISKSVLEKCDFLISIPMHGQVNSLNAAVATGIVVFEACKLRKRERQ